MQNSDRTSFNANLKIKRTIAFKSPSKHFEEMLAQNMEKWEQKADLIGSDRDTVTITLGKNNINVNRGEEFKKQHITATAKVNGIEMKNNDLEFEYIKADDNADGYFNTLKETIEDYLDFIKRFANCKIIKRTNNGIPNKKQYIMDNCINATSYNEIAKECSTTTKHVHKVIDNYTEKNI